MAHRRLAEALQLSRLLASVAHSDDEDGVDEQGLDFPTGLTLRCQIPLSKDTHSIYSLRFAPSGGQLAAGFGNGALQLVNVATGSLASSLSPGQRRHHAVTSLCYHPGKPSLLLAAGADGIISVYDLETLQPVASVTEKENEINALDFCLDGSTFATAGKDRHIRLYDGRTHQLSQILEAPDFMAGDEFTPSSGHSRRIFALRFHPTELHIFLTGGWDDSVKFCVDSY